MGKEDEYDPFKPLVEAIARQAARRLFAKTYGAVYDDNGRVLFTRADVEQWEREERERAAKRK